MVKIIEALEFLAQVVANGESVTPNRITATAELLKDLPEEAVLAAIRVHAKESAFFPAPSEIRKRITLTDVSGIEATENIWRAVRQIGIYGDPTRVLSDDEMAAVDSVGGWRVLCNSSEENASFISSQLKKACSVLTARREIEKQLGPGKTIAGLLEEQEIQERLDDEEEWDEDEQEERDE